MAEWFILPDPVIMSPCLLLPPPANPPAPPASSIDPGHLVTPSLAFFTSLHVSSPSPSPSLSFFLSLSFLLLLSSLSSFYFFLNHG